MIVSLYRTGQRPLYSGLSLKNPESGIISGGISGFRILKKTLCFYNTDLILLSTELLPTCHYCPSTNIMLSHQCTDFSPYRTEQPQLFTQYLALRIPMLSLHCNSLHCTLQTFLGMITLIGSSKQWDHIAVRLKVSLAIFFSSTKCHLFVQQHNPIVSEANWLCESTLHSE